MKLTTPTSLGEKCELTSGGELVVGTLHFVVSAKSNRMRILSDRDLMHLKPGAHQIILVLVVALLLLLLVLLTLLLE